MEEKIKKIKIEYQGEIYLEFKQIKIDKDNYELHLTNETMINKMSSNSSCLTIQVNKIEKIAYIQNIENQMCFDHEFFTLKKIGSFYMIMTIKMLKKYQDKFNINKIQLRDNSSIRCLHKKTKSFSLAYFYFLTKGITWYMNFGFKLIDLNQRNNFKEMSEKYKLLQVKDIQWENIYEEIKKDNNYKFINQDYLILFQKIISENRKNKLIKILDDIFSERDENFCIIFTLILEPISKYLDSVYKINLKDFKSYHLKLENN